VVCAIPGALLRRGLGGNEGLGEFDQKTWAREIAEALKAIKADDESLKLQNEFFEKAKHPLDTPQ